MMDKKISTRFGFFVGYLRQIPLCPPVILKAPKAARQALGPTALGHGGVPSAVLNPLGLRGIFPKKHESPSHIPYYYQEI